MSHETEKPGYPKPCDGPGIRADICVSDEYGNLKLAETVKIAGEGADLLRQAATGPQKVNASLERTATIPTADQALWSAIRNRTDAISFDRYATFIDRLLCKENTYEDRRSRDMGAQVCPSGTRDKDEVANASASGLGAPSIEERRRALVKQPSIYGIDAYQLLKVATQAFLLFETGVVINERDPKTGDLTNNLSAEALAYERARLDRPALTYDELQRELIIYLESTLGGVITERGLPYLKRIANTLVGFGGVEDGSVIQKLPYCETIMRNRFSCPSMLELIWSYWHEEGMLVQTTNAIALRFQNRRRGTRDPLTNLELDPLFPLNNILWGFIQDEYSRLRVQRRAYEYDHHYGLTLYGKAIAHLDSADSRSKFISAFHNLLYRTAMFYREDDDTTVRADAFTLLNALRAVHIILAEGAHNQFGDLPWTARAEMLIMQWMLARPEIRAFLRGRHMVPYQEDWMGAVDDMKRLQGWTDTTVTHFHELAQFGEQIVLSFVTAIGSWSMTRSRPGTGPAPGVPRSSAHPRGLPGHRTQGGDSKPRGGKVQFPFGTGPTAGRDRGLVSAPCRPLHAIDGTVFGPQTVVG